MTRWARDEGTAPVVLLIVCAALYTSTGYGGIRSPDCEVVYRVAESLATEGSFAVDRPLESWDFGLTPGRDGKLYSFYGPGQPLVAAPMVAMARAAVADDWTGDESRYLPLSHYTDTGLQDQILGRRPARPAEHARRRIVVTVYGGFSVVVAALLWALLRRIGIGRRAAVATTALYAVGTLAWPFAGTFFKEPLAMAFVLAAALATVEGGRQGRGCRVTRSPWRLALVGVLFGCGVATQETTLLFVPVWIGWVAVDHGRGSSGVRGALAPAAALLGGLGLIVAGLMLYNAARFGSPLATGRAAATVNTFAGPWTVGFYRGLYGLFLGAGKGLLLYCPAVLLALPFWRGFHREHRVMSWVVIASVALRVPIVAANGAWHGGFGPGPRYLLMLVPLLMLPIGYGIDAALRQRDRGSTAAGLWAVVLLGYGCAVEQSFLVTGEVFSWTHIARRINEQAGIDLFAGDQLYLNWAVSPLRGLLSQQRGPWLLHDAPGGNVTLWLASCALLAALTYLLVAYLRHGREGA